MENLGRWATSWVAAVAVALALLCVKYTDPSITKTLRLKDFDYLLTSQKQEISEDIVLIDIGEPTLKEWGQWPPKRDVFARLIENLREKGAGVVAFNVLFAEKDRLGGDTEFATSLTQGGIVISQTVSVKGQSPDAQRRGVAKIGEDPAPWTFGWKGGVSPISVLAEAADGVGVIATTPEIDGVTRRMPMIVRLGDQLYPSLPLEIIRVATGDPSYQIKTTEAGIEAVRIPQFPTVKTDSNGRIWLSQNQKFERIEAVDLLNDKTKVNVEGKTVIIGLTAEGLGSIIATPRGETFAHDLQANALATLLSGKTITRLPIADFVELLGFALFALVMIVLVPRTSVKLTIPLYAVIIGGAVYGHYWLFVETLALWDASFIVTAGSLVFFHLVFNNFAREFRLKQQIKKQFGSYLSPKMVEKLQENPDLLKLGGDSRELSIMFTDVRGFTTISEHYGADVQGLTKIMNRYMTAMTRKIIDNEGTLDKYIGDAQMAFWNAPLDDAQHAKNAVRTALEMLDSLSAFNAEVTAEGIPPFGMGLGINTGVVVVGNMGSEQRFDYTCLGDSVNLASRLEGQSKPYHVAMVIGPLTNEYVKDQYFTLPLDCLAVKGKKTGVDIFTVLGEMNKLPVGYKAAKSQHLAMYASYQKQQFGKAKSMCKDLKGQFDGKMDAYYDMWMERCDEYTKNPPGEGWDTVYRTNTK
jgi:adenylate cyclase